MFKAYDKAWATANYWSREKTSPVTMLGWDSQRMVTVTWDGSELDPFMISYGGFGEPVVAMWLPDYLARKSGHAWVWFKEEYNLIIKALPDTHQETFEFLEALRVCPTCGQQKETA